MARVKGAMMTRKRRNKVLKLAKGYWGAKSKHFRVANQAVMKSLSYAYTGRKLKKRDFRSLWITRISAACKMNGMNYFNSYLLTDGKTVLFDTADASVCRVFLENVAHGLNGRALDYLVVQHMEPDHAADIRDLLVRHPETTVVCSAAAKNMLAQFFGPGYEGRISVVKEGDTLCTGRHTLHFVAAPMVHWPEVLILRRLERRAVRRRGGLPPGLSGRGPAVLHQYCGQVRRTGPGGAEKGRGTGHSDAAAPARLRVAAGPGVHPGQIRPVEPV